MGKKLVEYAKDIVGQYALHGFEGNTAGKVSAALLTEQGNIYTGINIDVACSLGFCAEHSAIAEMLKNRETHVVSIVAVRDDGAILPPCGRCREMLMQINFSNADARVIVAENKSVLLRELLPFHWNDIKD
ncbi:MAG: cytidine deaminase [Oscillospiraceae bacterium]|nr:cytidine deaminase [Oscillospiraceae bacterium]